MLAFFHTKDICQDSFSKIVSSAIDLAKLVER